MSRGRGRCLFEVCLRLRCAHCRQACAANREERAGASLLAQIIVGRFASYLLINGTTLFIRRVECDFRREIKALDQSGLPRTDWIAKSLLAAPPQML